MAKAQLQEFVETATSTVSQIFLPTERIALEYGVSDLEAVEYSALEVARESAEARALPLIIAYEVSDDLIATGHEMEAGILSGDFRLMFSDAVAFYLITDLYQELEWYDATESALCLAKVGQ
jgi:hypothetical protein